MSRRKKDPDPSAVLRFIAEHESLQLTVEEFPDVREERIREILLQAAELVDPAPKASEVEVPRPKATAVAATKRFVLHTDGASRGNPGPSAAGWVISTLDGVLVAQSNALLGRRTNNEAEYEAVIHGVTHALELGAEEIALRADSELLIRQINGEYQVKNERIAVLHGKVRELLRGLRRFSAKHVRREQNSAADAMANEALDNGRGARSALV